MPKRQQLFFVCTGKDCKKRGIKKELKRVSKDLKKRFSKSEIRIVETKCLDLCKRGPNVIFKNEFYSKVDTQKIERILSEKQETESTP